MEATKKKIANEEIFWLDEFNGKARGGFFIRNDLCEFFKRCEKQGLRIVGIRKPTDMNLEVIMEVNKKFTELYSNEDKTS